MKLVVLKLPEALREATTALPALLPAHLPVVVVPVAPTMLLISLASIKIPLLPLVAGHAQFLSHATTTMVSLAALSLGIV